MRTSFKQWMFLIVICGIFSVAATAACKAVDAPDKYPHSGQNSNQTTNLGTNQVQAQTPARTQAQSQNQNRGESSFGPSFEEMITPNMKRFIMVYQTLLEGETEPCG